MDFDIFTNIFLGCVLIIAGVFDVKWLFYSITYSNTIARTLSEHKLGHKFIRYSWIVIGTLLVIYEIYEIIK